MQCDQCGHQADGFTVTQQIDAKYDRSSNSILDRISRIDDPTIDAAAEWLAAEVTSAEKDRGASVPEGYHAEVFRRELRRLRDAATQPDVKLGLEQTVSLDRRFQVTVRPGAVYGYRGNESRPAFIWPEAEKLRLEAKWSRLAMAED